MDFKDKYLKYKKKYLDLKILLGGNELKIIDLSLLNQLSTKQNFDPDTNPETELIENFEKIKPDIIEIFKKIKENNQDVYKYDNIIYLINRLHELSLEYYHKFINKSLLNKIKEIIVYIYKNSPQNLKDNPYFIMNIYVFKKFFNEKEIKDIGYSYEYIIGLIYLYKFYIKGKNVIKPLSKNYENYFHYLFHLGNYLNDFISFIDNNLYGKYKNDFSKYKNYISKVKEAYSKIREYTIYNEAVKEYNKKKQKYDQYIQDKEEYDKKKNIYDNSFIKIINSAPIEPKEPFEPFEEPIKPQPPTEIIINVDEVPESINGISIGCVRYMNENEFTENITFKNWVELTWYYKECDTYIDKNYFLSK
uniref:Uncharacterized protein n=1 Tax=viral metagenome TaxID=1070528 RepID=A0A6C0DAP4_9ZZZZ